MTPTEMTKEVHIYHEIMNGEYFWIHEEDILQRKKVTLWKGFNPNGRYYAYNVRDGWTDSNDGDDIKAVAIFFKPQIIKQSNKIEIIYIND
jgi:hypothetical protein